MSSSVPKIAFIGFGEAAQAFVSGWGDKPPGPISAFDIKTNTDASRVAKLADYAACRVRGDNTLADALQDADIVFSVVTAGNAQAAASQAAGLFPRGALFFDMNSVVPDTKRANAKAIEAAGGRYVDVGVMAPVYPAQLRVPMLLAGPHAAQATETMRSIGFNTRCVGDDVGKAAAVKIIRSIMVKGMEAVTAECVLAAFAAGVEDEVMASLTATWSNAAMPERADYNLDRMMVHGRRRAEEMRAATEMAKSLGLGGGMSASTAHWQDRIGELELPADGDLRDKVAAILSAFQRGG